MRNHRSTWLLITTVLFACLLLSCAAIQPPGVPHIGAPGFWKGFWHGLIAPITFIVSIFSDHIRIYAFPNTGKWYDLGFMIGIGGFTGGIFAGSRRRK